MPSTNKTTNLKLSQYIGTDIISYLQDYNDDMRKIDAGIGTGNTSTNAEIEKVKTKVDTVDAAWKAEVAKQVTAFQSADTTLRTDIGTKANTGLTNVSNSTIYNKGVSGGLATAASVANNADVNSIKSAITGYSTLSSNPSLRHTITSSQTWTSPINGCINVIIVGGGGAGTMGYGSGSSFFGGTGGGSGYMTFITIPTTIGQQYYVIIGAGATANSNSPGSSTNFGCFIAQGGGGYQDGGNPGAAEGNANGFKPPQGLLTTGSGNNIKTYGSLACRNVPFRLPYYNGARGGSGGSGRSGLSTVGDASGFYSMYVPGDYSFSSNNNGTGLGGGGACGATSNQHGGLGGGGGGGGGTNNGSLSSGGNGGNGCVLIAY